MSYLQTCEAFRQTLATFFSFGLWNPWRLLLVCTVPSRLLNPNSSVDGMRRIGKNLWNWHVINLLMPISKLRWIPGREMLFTQRFQRMKLYSMLKTKSICIVRNFSTRTMNYRQIPANTLNLVDHLVTKNSRKHHEKEHNHRLLLPTFYVEVFNF